jgi:hypothetical protein
MAARTTARRLTRSLVALLVFASAVLVPVVTPAPATAMRAYTALSSDAGDDGILQRSTTTFKPMPAKNRIHVTVSGHLENQTSSYSYLVGYGALTVPEVKNIKARNRKTGKAFPVDKELTDDGVLAVVSFNFGDDPLFVGKKLDYEITYDIPSQPPRSNSFTRVNPAFATFPVFALGDNGETSIRVEIPTGFEADVVGSKMKKSVAKGRTTYVAENMKDPAHFTAFVVVSDRSKLKRTTITLGKRSIAVQGWPGAPGRSSW